MSTRKFNGSVQLITCDVCVVLCVVSMDLEITEFLFGPSFDDLPWHQYHRCEVREVSAATLVFLNHTVGLFGTYHDENGWIVNHTLWAALMKYVQWCIDSQCDFKYHVQMVVEECDLFYTTMATTRMESFMDSSE